MSPEEAALDARLLAKHVLCWDSVALLTSSGHQASPEFSLRYEEAVQRRCRREPLAYITGTREFWNLPFDVSADVLIPRPETELLVEALLERFPAHDAPLHAIDVCTGSGCVAVAIATERPRARVTATDIQAPALAVARRNADRLGVGKRVSCVRTDLMAGLGATFHVVVANPPYVPEVDGPGLQPEVRDFEPPPALFGGPTGLAIIERLVPQAVEHLALRGLLIFEFGAGQGAAVQALISGTAGLTMLEIKADLAGIPRVAVAMRT